MKTAITVVSGKNKKRRKNQIESSTGIPLKLKSLNDCFILFI